MSNWDLADQSRMRAAKIADVLCPKCGEISRLVPGVKPSIEREPDGSFACTVRGTGFRQP